MDSKVAIRETSANPLNSRSPLRFEIPHVRSSVSQFVDVTANHIIRTADAFRSLRRSVDLNDFWNLDLSLH